MSDENAEVVILAAAAWNTALTASVFTSIVTNRPVDRSDCGSIFVTIKDFQENQLGQTWWDSCSAEIKFKPDLFHDAAMIVMIHELGHSLNLEHETDSMSVLHETAILNQEISDLSQCLVELALREGGAN